MHGAGGMSSASVQTGQDPFIYEGKRAEHTLCPHDAAFSSSGTPRFVFVPFLAHIAFAPYYEAALSACLESFVLENICKTDTVF